MTEILSIGEVSRILGVCVKTLHRRDKAGQLTPQFRTLGGHRRYNAADVLNLKGLTKLRQEHGVGRNHHCVFRKTVWTAFCSK